MTVAEMTPHQLFGLHMLAFVVIVLALLGWRELSNLETKRQKFVFWLGMAAMVGLPALYGLSALRL